MLDGWLTRIKQYYETQLRMPYGAAVTLLASTPVSQRNDWMFVTYPTIAAVNPRGSLGDLVQPTTLTLADSASVGFLSHELGHYYFGTVLSPNSALRWVFLEGITEYLSLQAVRDLLGKSFYDRQLWGYVSASRRLEHFVPLASIKASGEAGETYRYKYVPLLLTALEAQIGREQVWKWLRTLLNAEKPVTNYNFLVNSLRNSGADAQTVARFEKEYLLSEGGLTNLLAAYKADGPHKYCFGISREVPKEPTREKLQVIYTPIQKVPDDDAQVNKLGQRFFAFVKGQCKPANEMCTGDFNSYLTPQEAGYARERMIRELSRKGNYTFREVDLNAAK